ncbi:hypothetical protein VTN96DRAFT_3796 [Rasamsonia emersonii]
MVLNDFLATTGRLGVALVLLLAYPLFKVIYNLYFHPLAPIPGPRSWSASHFPFVWALLKGTIVHDIEKVHRRYGPILRIAPDEVTFSKAEAWADIFQIRPDHQQFLKDPIWWKRRPDQPDSLLTAIDPELHARILKLLTPAFTPRALRAQEPIVQRYVSLLIVRLHERVSEAEDGKGVEIDIAPWFNYTTFDIFGDLGFGESFDCLQHSRYHPWIALLLNSVKAASFVAAARFYPLGGILVHKVSSLNWELERPDIMSHVINKNGEIGLPIGEINATFMILTTAGSETTAAVLCVSIQAYSLNRDPTYFHSASSFLPECWLPEASTDPNSPSFHDERRAVQPFSVGPRACMGQHIAWAEMRLVLAKLLWTFDFEAIEGKKLKWEELRTFLLVEKKPLEMWMKLRSI